MENTSTAPAQDLADKISHRRTFAIISHPDAGKTTLTEKMLLYSGAIALAGNVRARKTQRATVSDWMDIEKTRGISIASSVLQFVFKDYVINLLDTPGHDDFSEDTYRTLTAVDSAVMIIDAAKGIEEQTKKLFEVCRQRGIPIFTFINKLDRPSKPPLALLDEIEEVLGMQPVPLAWPIGDGVSFKGVYDRVTRQVALFERSVRNETTAAMRTISLDAFLAQLAQEQDGSQLLHTLKADLELLDGLGIAMQRDKVLSQHQTPVFFGSALTNFGVEQFLASFVELAPPPQEYIDRHGERVTPASDDFSAFIFKVQANLDPRHRDSVAFIRICSGQFNRGMSVVHAATSKDIRLPVVYKTFAQERAVVNEAVAGDIVAIPSNGRFAIGDTLYSGKPIDFMPLPSFAPEIFGTIRMLDVTKSKQFDKGLKQLADEGAIQIFFGVHASRREPILAAVGMLQFDVVKARLESEYNVAVVIEPTDYETAQWVVEPAEPDVERYSLNKVTWAQDTNGNFVVLFRNKFIRELFLERHPEVKLSPTSPL